MREGLYYYNARYYNPTLGRFITADTVLDGLNRYTYCGNNPVRYTDPTGNDHTRAEKADSKTPDWGGSGEYSERRLSSAEAYDMLHGTDVSGIELPCVSKGKPPHERGRDREPEPGNGPGSDAPGPRKGMWLVDGPVTNPPIGAPRQTDSYDLIARDAYDKRFDDNTANSKLNTIYNFGCAYTSLVIYINNLIRSEPSFNAGVRKEVTLNIFNIQKYFEIEGNGKGGYDVNLTLTGIEAMVKDATGFTVRASKLEGEAARAMLSFCFSTPVSDRRAGIIANVSNHEGIAMHWVYTYGIKNNGELKYHETYAPWADKTFVFSDVSAIFLIEVLR